MVTLKRLNALRKRMNTVWRDLDSWAAARRNCDLDSFSLEAAKDVIDDARTIIEQHTPTSGPPTLKRPPAAWRYTTEEGGMWHYQGEMPRAYFARQPLCLSNGGWRSAVGFRWECSVGRTCYGGLHSVRGAHSGLCRKLFTYTAVEYNEKNEIEQAASSIYKIKAARMERERDAARGQRDSAYNELAKALSDREALLANHESLLERSVKQDSALRQDLADARDLQERTQSVLNYWKEQAQKEGAMWYFRREASKARGRTRSIKARGMKLAKLLWAAYCGKRLTREVLDEAGLKTWWEASEPHAKWHEGRGDLGCDCNELVPPAACDTCCPEMAAPKVRTHQRHDD